MPLLILFYAMPHAHDAATPLLRYCAIITPDDAAAMLMPLSLCR